MDSGYFYAPYPDLDIGLVSIPPPSILGRFEAKMEKHRLGRCVIRGLIWAVKLGFFLATKVSMLEAWWFNFVTTKLYGEKGQR